MGCMRCDVSNHNHSFTTPIGFAARIGLLLNALVWSLPVFFIKYLSYSFDPFTQNFYRSLSATVGLFLYVWLGKREELPRVMSEWRLFVPPAIIFAAAQILYVEGIYKITASLAAILERGGLVFVVIFSYFLLRDERGTIRSKGFLSGASLSFAGMMGVILGGGDISLQGHTAGVLLLITSGTLYGLYTVGIAKATKYLDPLAATFAIVASSTVIFGVAAAIYGEPGQIFHVDWKINLFLLISGLIGIAAGHTLFFINVKKVGNVLTNTFLLLTPLIGVTLAFLFLGEKLTLLQIVSGVVLIGGSYLVVTRGQTRTFNENL